ncbi:ECU03_1115 [Encephalitozoon cuniculi GB-M1]|uniref:ECU03_1115 protein n=1 Tax=Encephalitozoon cuniculi (strain GB-M1) TaxID=284813 RepID=I7L8H1_ENCCU|nr:uncharacterized protein ECU03_1115 [Encephalitozoon cuniculi GB-M1]CCI73917.1 ECU03_1115 [Encephalitozoon cuniculi GB-M1]
MFLPPDANTKERRRFDLDDLRVYYLICEELGISEEEHIQKSFYYLMKWAGQDKFGGEVGLLRSYILRIRKERQSRSDELDILRM